MNGYYFRGARVRRVQSFILPRVQQMLLPFSHLKFWFNGEWL